MVEFLDLAIGLPVDYQNGRSARKSHLRLLLRWIFKTRELRQTSSPTLRIQEYETASIPTGPWAELENLLDPLWLRRDVYSDIGCRIAIELDDLTIAARQESELPQVDRDRAIYLLLLILMEITKGEKTDGDILRVEIDAKAYEMYREGNFKPASNISFHNSAQKGQYASLQDNEARVSMKTKLGAGQRRQSAWGWNMDTKELRPLNSLQASLIVEGKTDVNPENGLVIEACRRLDPNFLLRHENTMKYKGNYNLASLENLHQEIAGQTPIDYISDVERKEIADLLGATAYRLLFGDLKLYKPVYLRETNKLDFVPIENFGPQISIQPMVALNNL